ncbi:MAG TPA: hypothetical protein VLA36_06300 [Longimicrobiales bacterium]|nr:hypothetical protein [Longimicrobiales bacterium]
MPSDRRTFLRHVAALGVLGPVSAAWACADRSDSTSGSRSPEAPSPDRARSTSFALRPGPADTVHVVAPAAEPPVAYVSRGDMRVYLDPKYRDWAEHRLAAYVSVTTGLWRIRRPEDDPGVPIVPGDELREFEVVDLGLWDPGMTPVEGDVRLRLGSPIPVLMDLSCARLSAVDAWISAGRTVVQRRDGPAGEGGREDFTELGTGTRHPDPACSTAGRPVRILTWACPPERDEA